MGLFDRDKPRRELRPHQVKAIELLRQSMAAGNKRVVLQAATGFGKTLVSANIIQSALSRGKRVVFTVPRISLVDQSVSEFEVEGIPQIGVIQANHFRYDPMAPVQVASTATLRKRDFFPDTDFVLVDEAHMDAEVIYRWMRAKPNMPFVGLSATPWARGMGDHWQDLVHAISMQELIDQGYLCPFTVYAPSHPDLSAVKTGASGDYQEKHLSEVMGESVLVADVVETWKARAQGLPTLVFAVDLAHASKIQKAFADAGIPMGYVEAKTDMVERKLLLARMERGELAGIVSVGTMTTGVDADVRCVVLARPTKSEITHVQTIGRGLRNAPGKKTCIILDHSDNHARLGFVTDIHHDQMLKGKEKAEPKAKEQAERIPRECPSCGAVKARGPCGVCGFEPTRQSEIEFEAGELVEIKPKADKPKELGRDQKQEWWSSLLAIARDRGRSRGWAAHAYKEKTGVWPRGLEDTPARYPNGVVASYVKAKDIRFAKSRGKA